MLVVSLTTTRSRLSLCRASLISLALQTYLPDQIILWVSSGGYLYDDGFPSIELVDDFLGQLPNAFRRLIDVRWVENIGPYRKLMPVLRESGVDDVVVTADDDIFYGRNWLKKLITVYNANDKVAVASRVREKSYNCLGKRKSYVFWTLVESELLLEKGFIVTFGGGVVLSRRFFLEDDLFDDSFIEVAPTSDDLWYSKLLARAQTRVQVAPEASGELGFIFHDQGLVKHNFPNRQNFLGRVSSKIWTFFGGQLGLPVCVNDQAYRAIDAYFDTRPLRGD